MSLLLLWFSYRFFAPQCEDTHTNSYTHTHAHPVGVPSSEPHPCVSGWAGLQHCVWCGLTGGLIGQWKSPVLIVFWYQECRKEWVSWAWQIDNRQSFMMISMLFGIKCVMHFLTLSSVCPLHVPTESWWQKLWWCNSKLKLRVSLRRNKGFAG